MKNLLLIMCLILSYTAHSQSIDQVSIFAASSITSESSQMTWTLGDFQTETFNPTGSGLVLTQGFLQAYLNVTDVGTIGELNAIEMKVFPNPVREFLNLEFNKEKRSKVVFNLYNIEGKLIWSKNVESDKYKGKLDFRQFKNGIYVLKAISEDENYVKTFKIFYQN